jgi:hypothetical protein
VELSELRGVVIKRSLRPAQLPREVLDYLSPRQRVCYFFERAVPLMSAVEGRHEPVHPFAGMVPGV